MVVSAVLAAALLHATWNALLKNGRDRLFTLLVMELTMSVIAGCCLLFLPLPPLATWPWILAGMALHHGYRMTLIHGYARADLGEIYPIARGLAPILVTLGAFLLAGDRLSPRALLGVLLVSGGILFLARSGGRMIPRQTLLAGLAISLFIASYTIVDGMGARLSGLPVSYSLLLFCAGGPLTLATWVLLRGTRMPATQGSEVAKGMISGTVSLLGYAVVIWALTQGSMGRISALRETSVLFAVVLGVLFLGEQLSLRRILAAGLMAAGAVLLGLG